MPKPDDMDQEQYDWLINAADRNCAMIDDSKVFLSLFSRDMTKDAIPCLQLGLAMMLDKPIIVVAAPEDEIPENLQNVAVAIFQGDLNDERFKEFLGKELLRLSKEEQ
jgi:hypothetical protein